MTYLDTDLEKMPKEEIENNDLNKGEKNNERN